MSAFRRLLYTLPYSYGFATRSKTLMDKLSFLCIWLFPQLFTCYRHSELEGWKFLTAFLLAATAQYSVYELGYIANDFETAAREKSPNHRLSAEKRRAMEPHLKTMRKARKSWAVACCVFLGFYAYELHLLRFFAMLSALAVAFAAHNRVRSRLNIVTYLVLCSVKYTALPFLFFPLPAMPYLVFRMLLCFVLPRTFEHASKKKYGFERLWGLPRHRLRVNYYAALSVFAVALFPLLFDGEAFLRLAVWYYLYRTIVYEASVLWGDPRRAF